MHPVPVEFLLLLVQEKSDSSSEIREIIFFFSLTHRRHLMSYYPVADRKLFGAPRRCNERNHT